MIIKLDFDVCKGGRVQGKKVIGMRYNYKDIYSLIGNYNAYTVEITESGYKTVNFDISSEYYYSAIDPYYDMGDGTRFYENVLSYTYTTPGTYLIITSARIDRTIGNCPNVVAINGIRRDSISFENAFEEYLRLTTHEFEPQNVKTSRVTTMKNAFLNCITKPSRDYRDPIQYITVVGNFNNWDVSNVTDMSGMFSTDDTYSDFYYSNGYTYVFDRMIFDRWNTSNVRNMSKMFLNFKSWKTYPYYYDGPIDFSSWDTSNVTDMSEMFKGCREFTYDIGHFNTKNVITFKDMFRESNLKAKNYTIKSYKIDSANTQLAYTPTELELNLWDVSSANDMSGMFASCGAKTLNLSGWDTINVSTMNNMFEDCNELTTLNLAHFKTDNVIDMSCMFAGCDNLTSLDLSDFKTNNVVNMDEMFAGCSSLRTLDIRNFNTYKATNKNMALGTCQNLYDLRLDNCFKTTIADVIDTLKRNSLNGTTDPEKIECAIRIIHCDENRAAGLTAPKNWMFSFDYEKNVPLYSSGKFADNASLTSIETRVSSSHSNLRRMCYNCINLTEINVKNFDTSNVIDMSEMFSGCRSLSSQTRYGFSMPDWNTSRVKYTYNMFHNCSSLTDLDLSNWKTSEITNMDDMFRDCTSLNYLKLTNWQLRSDCSLQNAFSGCTNLVYLYLDNCDKTTVEKIITSAGFPTNNLGNYDRIIYVNYAAVDGLEPPANWSFRRVDYEI